MTFIVCFDSLELVKNFKLMKVIDWSLLHTGSLFLILELPV